MEVELFHADGWTGVGQTRRS